ncbi:MAG: DUF4012 domain-containing protein [Chloroflexi bacterium]|nr:DUF4012 domain-containing protein [Chloroflexota bacterium]
MNTEKTVLTESDTKTTPWVKYLLLGAVLLLLLWAGLKAWRIGSAAYSLWQVQTEVRTLAEGGLTGIDPDQAEEMVRTVRQDVLTLQEETAVFMPLTPYLGWVPKVGPLLVAAPHLMEMADAGTETAAYAMRGLKPGLAALQSENEVGESRLPQLVSAIDQARPDLLQAAQSLDKVAAARSQIDNVAQFPGKAQELMALFDEMLPLAQDGLKLAQVLPQMAGVDGPRRYLILAQNEDELRPTGGFLTGVGVLEVDNGRIAQMDFQDANLVDDWAGKPYDFPPQPLYDFMGLELFSFRDANFWPDFPTSAEQAIALYSYGQDLDPAAFDGVIAIDQLFLALLVGGTGPVDIPKAGLTLTEENLINTLRDTWVSQAEAQAAGQNWSFTRKAFLEVFASAIRNRLESDMTAVNPVALGRNMFQAAQSKHLQLYMRDPEVMAVLEELGWDGRLENSTGQDFLMVVDTSMGFNKANIYIDRQLTYNISLEGENPQAHLRISYNHNGPASNEKCEQDTSDEYAAAQEYLEIADQCYFNYLRVYVPDGSQLLDSTRQTLTGEELITGKVWDNTAQTVQEFNGFTTFTNFIIVPRGQSRDYELTYRLPADVVQSNDTHYSYQLILLKQAGTTAQTTTITVSLPSGAEFISAAPQPTAVTDSNVTFDLLLDSDQLIEVNYRMMASN